MGMTTRDLDVFRDGLMERPKFTRLIGWLVDLTAVVGLFILVTGGLRTRQDSLFGPVNFTSYGPFFLPLALCLAFRFQPLGSRLVPRVQQWAATFDGLESRTRTRCMIATIAVALAAHGLVVYLRYYTFQAAMDLAIYANACHGALFSTMKGDVWLFADHFEPLLLLFTPLCRAFSPAISLLTVQTIGWGVGAYGIFVLAQRQGYRPALAWLCATLYLNLTGHVTMAYYDFHLLTLTLALMPWIWWAIATERYGLLVLFAVLYLGLKESAALSVAGLGAFLLITRDRKRRTVGALLIVLGMTTFVLIMKVIYPAFRGGEGTMYFSKYYGHLGNNLSEFIHTALTRPVYFAYHLLKPKKLLYLAGVLAPFLLFPLRYPLYALPVIPAILINILSNKPSMFSAGYHYEAEILPALFAMAVVAFSQHPRARALWLVVLLVGFTSTSALATARWNVPTQAQRRLAKDLAAHVPKDRAIAAPQRIAAHLTDRDRLYMFDYWLMEDDWKRADIVVVGFHGLSIGWYRWDMLEEVKLVRMQPGLKLLYQSPEDPRFRVFEVLPSAKDLPSIADPGASADSPVGK
jgi:uncharacterized membrane protein